MPSELNAAKWVNKTLIEYVNLAALEYASLANPLINAHV